MMISKENLKKKMSEQNKANKKYLEKLELLKQSYGVEFRVKNLKNNDLDTVTFYNISFHSTFKNITVIYDNKYNKFDYLSYECYSDRVVKNLNIHKLIDSLNKEKKLKLLVDEIFKLTNEYKQELNEIEKKYGNFDEQYGEKIHELEFIKKRENE